MHAKTLWACDFASKRVWTTQGLVDAFVLVFIHVASRRVWASPSTTNPNGEWVVGQARAFAAAAAGAGQPPGQLIHDSDSKFQGAFGARAAPRTWASRPHPSATTPRP